MGRDLAMPASASRQPAASSCFLTPPFLWSQSIHHPPCAELWRQFPSRVETKCVSLALRSPSAKVVRSVLRSPLPCQGPSSESYQLHPWTLLDLHSHPTAGNTSRVSHLNVSFQVQQGKSLCSSILLGEMAVCLPFPIADFSSVFEGGICLLMLLWVTYGPIYPERLWATWW